MQFNLINTGETSNITVFHEGNVKVATDDHPYWGEIVAGAIAGDESILDLFDLTAPVARKLQTLTSRISVANGRVYFDGDEVNNTLADQIVRFVREGVEDWKPLAAFYEKIMTNLNEHTREQLYSWLAHQSMAVTPAGNFVAYKGVKVNRNYDNENLFQYQSISHGTAFVNGTEFKGAIPNFAGAVVTMPRSEVQHDPSVGCHTGLHAGTWTYASDFAQGAVLEVEIDPKDVVSVPSDCDAQKLRVSRYVVRGVIEQERLSVVANYDDHGYIADEYDDGGWDSYEDDDEDPDYF